MTQDKGPKRARIFNPLVAVLDSKGKRIPHLFTRGEKFYGVAYHHGKRKMQSLPSCLNKDGRAVMDEVRRYCADFVKRVEAEDWHAITATRRKVDRKVATIGELCAAYLAGCKSRGEPRAETAHGNCLALRYIVRKGLGLAEDAEVDHLAGDVLTAKLKKDCWAALMGDKTGEDWASARRTMSAKERGACSIFKWRGDEGDDFEALLLPDTLDKFISHNLGKVPTVNYQPPPNEVCAATITAGRALTGALGLAWLLTYDLALRCGEAANARWSWLEYQEDTDGSRWLRMRIATDEESGHRSKSERCEETAVRYVPVPEGVLAKLLEFAGRKSIEEGRATDEAGNVTDFILRDTGPSGRRDFVTRTFAAWLRGVSPYWMEQQKAAHELRKLKGCYWRRKFGLDVCHEWIGHSDYNTTIKYYAKLMGQQEAQGLDEAGFVARWSRRI